jgi:hypothetical protein
MALLLVSTKKIHPENSASKVFFRAERQRAPCEGPACGAEGNGAALCSAILSVTYFAAFASVRLSGGVYAFWLLPTRFALTVPKE